MTGLLQYIINIPMRYTTLNYYLLVGLSLLLYYILPLKIRWLAILVTNAVFILQASTSGRLVFLGTIIISWIWGLVLEKCNKKEAGVQAEGAQAQGAQAGETQAEGVQAQGEQTKGKQANVNAEEAKGEKVKGEEKKENSKREEGGEEKRERSKKEKALLAAAIVTGALPLWVVRINELVFTDILHTSGISIAVPLGLSFYSLQLIAYFADIYRGKIHAQKNILRFFVFVTFFPQLIQGPIPRYAKLEDQLITGHKFDPDEFTKGFMLILWGFFLKYMIADRAGIYVDAVFGDWQSLSGSYIFLAAVLYSIQLYTDFLSCTTLSQGVAELYGIHLADNFDHPYFSCSVRDFWRRWHMSFSFWLRDYVYIPLGGNRKGKARKYVNLVITFAVSGLWHGGGVRFLFWGLLHAFYQICEGLLKSPGEKLCRALSLPPASRLRRGLGMLWTFFRVMLAWVIFRADTLRAGLFMIAAIFTSPSPWIFTSGALLDFGLDGSDWVLLFLSILVLIFVSRRQEKESIRDRVLAMHLPLRWCLYMAGIFAVVIFGSYGMGYEASDFIYGGF